MRRACPGSASSLSFVRSLDLQGESETFGLCFHDHGVMTGPYAAISDASAVGASSEVAQT